MNNMTYTSAINSQQNTDIMQSWMQILQKNSKSEAVIQSELLKSVSETVKEIRKETQEALTTGKTKDDDAVQLVSSSEEIQSPSEITTADLQSPIDIKL